MFDVLEYVKISKTFKTPPYTLNIKAKRFTCASLSGAFPSSITFARVAAYIICTVCIRVTTMATLNTLIDV